jgi:hypothetical protein
VRAVASTDHRREALEELTLGLSVLRGELERAEPLMRKVGQQDLVLFEGTPDRLRFANAEPPYLAGPPYLIYEYSVTLDDGSYRIALRRVPFDPSDPDLAIVEEGEPRTVLRTGQALQFSYFGKLRQRDKPGWHGEWPPGPRLPDAIRLAAGDDPGWPDLVVPLRITAPWYCGGADTETTAGCPGADNPAESRLPPRDGAEPTASDRSEQPFGAASEPMGRGRRSQERSR